MSALFVPISFPPSGQKCKADNKTEKNKRKQTDEQITKQKSQRNGESMDEDKHI